MKKQTETNFSKISKEQTNHLTTVIDETIATDFIAVKNFTIVDLWNIHRKVKNTSRNRKPATFY